MKNNRGKSKIMQVLVNIICYAALISLGILMVSILVLAIVWIWQIILA